jgi:hypothetical protein
MGSRFFKESARRVLEELVSSRIIAISRNTIDHIFDNRLLGRTIPNKYPTNIASNTPQ